MPSSAMPSEREMARQAMQHQADAMADHVLGRHPASAAKRKALATQLMACCDAAVED